MRAKEQRREDLFAKQGRGSEFRNKDERDHWIKKVCELLFVVQNLNFSPKSRNVILSH